MEQVRKVATNAIFGFASEYPLRHGRQIVDKPGRATTENHIRLAFDKLPKALVARGEFLDELVVDLDRKLLAAASISLAHAWAGTF